MHLKYVKARLPYILPQCRDAIYRVSTNMRCTLWKRWINAYRWYYNWTIAELKGGTKGSSYELQKLARNAERPSWVKELPGHQLQEAVADAVDGCIPYL